MVLMRKKTESAIDKGGPLAKVGSFVEKPNQDPTPSGNPERRWYEGRGVLLRDRRMVRQMARDLRSCPLPVKDWTLDSDHEPGTKPPPPKAKTARAAPVQPAPTRKE